MQEIIETKPKHAGGRPTDYNSELAQEICDRLAEGRSVNSVCQDEDMPDKSQVFRWLAKYEEFRDKYRACLLPRADALSENMIDIAINSLTGEIKTTKETKDGTFEEVRISDNVERSKLIVHTLQWQLARMAPKKYGDKTAVEHSGSIGLGTLVEDSLKPKDVPSK